MSGATIRLFLVHGDAKRLRTAEHSTWIGKAVAGPRSELDALIARQESEKPGVYLLTGTDSESGKSAVYVGEAESIRDRVKSHLDKDFWNHIVFFISKDENLTKAHVRYLEGRLIEQARESGRSIVVNGNMTKSKLPESDREDMELWLEKMHQLLPVLGVDVFLPSTSSPAGHVEKQLLYCDIKGIRASGHLTPSGFIVLQGSQAVANVRASASKWPYTLATRNKLLEEGTLVRDSGFLKFTRDAEFTSASAAATVIHGGSANGLLAWKTTDGKTLKELEAD